MNVRVEAERARQGNPVFLAKVADTVALMKLRLNVLVLAAVATGYVLGAPAAVSLGQLSLVLLGVLLAGGGSSALNMAMEADRDRLMARTRNRPVAAGRVSAEEATAIGALLALLGVGAVALGGGWVAAALCAATVLLYVFVYTPLKTRTSFNTWVAFVEYERCCAWSSRD